MSVIKRSQGNTGRRRGKKAHPGQQERSKKKRQIRAAKEPVSDEAFREGQRLREAGTKSVTVEPRYPHRAPANPVHERMGDFTW